VNRWANLIVGIFYTIINVGMNFLLDLLSDDSYIYWEFFAIVEAVLTVLIVWYAWNWPSPED
jgi:hypothetical protein